MDENTLKTSLTVSQSQKKKSVNGLGLKKATDLFEILGIVWIEFTRHVSRVKSNREKIVKDFVTTLPWRRRRRSIS